jgi:hypothetical protein
MCAPHHVGMHTHKTTVAEELAAVLATHENVLMARGLDRRVTVEFPRELGGRYSMTRPEARRLIARLGLGAE